MHPGWAIPHQEAEEKVEEIREKLKEAQSRQKSYADGRRHELSFEVGDLVYLKVSYLRGKLAPCYISPYQVQQCVGKLAYKLQLPESLTNIHDAFHVSQLKKCLKEVPVKILDIITKRTRNATIKICQVLWSRHSKEEATWEREDAMRKEYQHLFETHRILGTRFLLSG
ncbi:hypothetical protein U9M48_036836, partial [Paspalum notatum var. saurae]